MRKQIRENLTLSEIQNNPEKHIWDVDYVSTSDEEDNDSDEDIEEEEDEIEGEDEGDVEGKGEEESAGEATKIDSHESQVKSKKPL